MNRVPSILQIFIHICEVREFFRMNVNLNVSPPPTKLAQNWSLV